MGIGSHVRPVTSRREFLARAGGGFGALAFSYLLGLDGFYAEAAANAADPGEFGRTPFNEKGDGRDHNPWGFTMWMAGGGAKGGTVIGTTDEIGLRGVEKRVHVHDLHATIFHLLGMDHERLTYLRHGRDERPTINGGKVIREVIA